MFDIVRPLSLYCLVDEVLRHGITSDEKKNLTFHSFLVFFSSHMHKIQKLHKSTRKLIFNRKSNFPTFFFLRPESKSKSLFLCYFLRQGTKHTCRSSSTKQCTESDLIRCINAPLSVCPPISANVPKKLEVET